MAKREFDSIDFSTALLFRSAKFPGVLFVHCSDGTARPVAEVTWNGERTEGLERSALEHERVHAERETLIHRLQGVAQPDEVDVEGLAGEIWDSVITGPQTYEAGKRNIADIIRRYLSDASGLQEKYDNLLVEAKRLKQQAMDDNQRVIDDHNRIKELEAERDVWTATARANARELTESQANEKRLRKALEGLPDRPDPTEASADIFDTDIMVMSPQQTREYELECVNFVERLRLQRAALAPNSGEEADRE